MRTTRTYDTVDTTRPPPVHTQVIHRVQQAGRSVDLHRPYLWDGLVTGAWVCAALTDYLGGGWRTVALEPQQPGWLMLFLTFGFTVPLFWRRTHPFAVLMCTTVVSFANSLSGAFFQAAFLQLLVLFHITLRLPFRMLWWSFALLSAPLVTEALRFSQVSWSQSVAQPLWAGVMAALLGTVVRRRREHTDALVERARRLEIERDQQARLAAAAERTRIAREMHDIIGHNLSVITGLADGGAYASKKSPERAGEALQAIASTSRQALSELRRLLDVLREDPPAAAGPELSPQPALADLDALVERVRSAGLPIRTTVQDTSRSVPPGLQLTVYRLVQEALTNTMKHAGPGAAAEVRVRYESGLVSITVTDTGGTPGGGPLPGTEPSAGPPGPPGPFVPPGTPSSGRGLAGMRERTALYQGTLDAGPVTDEQGHSIGWRVHALLSLPKEAAT
ncbi:histidine kinase [Streptomyces sp. NPDC005955]|uniref:sensor histidine kinase n=1 Tax=Streptomyces sp. NPDC005955 TaxID=3364738 RepID=UPI0036C61857